MCHIFYNFSNMSSSLWTRIKTIYQSDSQKQQRKSYGKFIGYFLLISFFIIVPQIYKLILQKIIEYVWIPNKIIPALGIIFTNFIILTTYNSLMYFIYTGKYTFFQKYRISSKQWPWEQNIKQWRELLYKSIKNVLINNIVIGVPMSIIDCLLSDYRFLIQEIPQIKTIVWQFFFFLFVQDLTFYITHSIFHRPQFYWIHKQHHQYHTTVTIAAEYAHPIESILGNAVPSFLGFKLLSFVYPVHSISIWTFFAFRIIETCDGHSGYQWSWALSQLLPFSAGSSYHNFHHSHNVGNFGSFFKFWDTVFGTNTEYLKFKKNREIIQKEIKQK